MTGRKETVIVRKMAKRKRFFSVAALLLAFLFLPSLKGAQEELFTPTPWGMGTAYTFFPFSPVPLHSLYNPASLSPTSLSYSRLSFTESTGSLLAHLKQPWVEPKEDNLFRGAYSSGIMVTHKSLSLFWNSLDSLSLERQKDAYLLEGWKGKVYGVSLGHRGRGLFYGLTLRHYRGDLYGAELEDPPTEEDAPLDLLSDLRSARNGLSKGADTFTEISLQTAMAISSRWNVSLTVSPLAVKKKNDGVRKRERTFQIGVQGDLTQRTSLSVLFQADKRATFYSSREEQPLRVSLLHLFSDSVYFSLAGQTDLKRKPLWGGGSLSTLSGGLGILMGRRFLLYVSSSLSPQGKLSGWGISAAFVDPWGKNP